MAGGQEYPQPNYSDAVPPKPARQGDMGPVHYQEPMTSSAPANTGAIESNFEALIDSDGLEGFGPNMDRIADKGKGEGIRGFRTTPVGGTNNP